LTGRRDFSTALLMLDGQKMTSIEALQAHFSPAGTFDGTVEYEALKPELNHRHSWLVYL
jgi:hypothetical protein